MAEMKLAAFKRSRVDTDLTSRALEDALGAHWAPSHFLSLVVPRALEGEAWRLSGVYGLGKPVVLPDEIMKPDSWALLDGRLVYWSPGA